MRLEDEDIIRILQKIGPATVSYVAYKLSGPVDRKRLGVKMKSLAKYGILERKPLDNFYIYKIPGDKRPACIEVPKEPQTTRDRFDSYVNQIPEGTTLNTLEISKKFNCRPDYARELINQHHKLRLAHRRENGYKVWVKGA